MLDAQGIDSLAQEMREAQDAATSVRPLTTRLPGFSLDDGYAIAARMHAARVAAGAVPRGRKIGFTNSAIWPEYDVHHPIWGHVYAHTLHGPGLRSHTLPLATFVEPKIEPELALGLREAPRARASAAELAACIAWVAPAFEIVQSHFPGWRFQAADTVADGGLHGALFLGEPVQLPDLGGDAQALADIPLDLLRDGTLVESGHGANALGGPLEALAHLVDLLATQPHLPPLHAGEVVTTGTLTAAWPVRAGETWTWQPRHTGLQPLTLRLA